MIDAHRAEAPQETGGPKRRQKREQPKRPTIGRTIHVIADAALASKLNAPVGDHLAAIVTGAWNDGANFNATVFSPVGNPPANGHPLKAAAEGMTWHWPEAS